MPWLRPAHTDTPTRHSLHRTPQIDSPRLSLQLTPTLSLSDSLHSHPDSLVPIPNSRGSIHSLSKTPPLLPIPDSEALDHESTASEISLVPIPEALNHESTASEISLVPIPE
ncbi:hypothetical protein RchiOBHm_Chr7g0221861 [Rosa chinensis]|uniref:Uncharacterized protein n=1 Tax=Rosa chinensis TaxID=74649 RepID=A0A2P6PD45_ROSCH|nr:hypothetical protein RchiOBHm_Chr7g0221861 [Rosa chinensis]